MVIQIPLKPSKLPAKIVSLCIYDEKNWRMGDFETGLGAASHVGHKDLVTYFLDNGAQANIFTMALFGKLDILKSMIAFSPNLIHAKGPHGYTLLHHAEQGGSEALEVKEYLISLGLKESRIPLY